MSNLLITGGAGFIGANFVHYWARHHPNDVIVVLDTLTDTGNFQNLSALAQHPSFTFVQGTILDQQLVEDLLRSRRLHVIVNFAAESHLNCSIHHPDACLKTNIEGTHTLLKAARNVWLDGRQNQSNCRFHHLSTVEVYGDLARDIAPFSENSPYAPNSPYAASKAAADHLVRSYHASYGLPVTISNSSYIFGRFHSPDQLIPLVISHILKNKSLPAYADDQPVRDWLYVQDYCRGIDQILLLGEVGQTYHIGSGNEWTDLEIIEFICNHLNKLFQHCSDYRTIYPDATLAARGLSRELILTVEHRAGQDRKYALDVTKITTALGWRTRYTFKGALEYTIGWYLRHARWL